MSMSAAETLSKGQKRLLIIFGLLLAVSLVLYFQSTVITILAFLTAFYLIHVIFSFYMLIRSMFYGQEIIITKEEIDNFKNWPKYTILCPLYKEANMLPDYVLNMSAIDYPKERLECLLLLEEDDRDTIKAAREFGLPDYFKIVVVPDSYPKTKPKACNFGLAQATGDFVVIYDAEDLPETDQLKKAILAFRKANRDVACIQAKLNYYNPNHNFLTRMFTSEYTLWFDLILPGFQSINAPIPLGGTSNHFPTKILRLLNGWDPYNVTEDCDLGLRLKEAGFKTEILDSTTWEEANCNLKNWIRQRSRWIKGYFQTFLVHGRTPIYTIRKIGFLNTMLFGLFTGFLPFASMINPFLWLTTISYFALRPIIGETIEQFFPGYILYPSAFCLIVGNFLYIYNYLVGSSKRGYDGLVKYGLLMPVYWLLISFAGWYGLIQLTFKPHFWEKTKHGLSKIKETNA
ncbi:MAG: glycosyltransferase family 2 protein [Patescibacteria group bacterium]